MYSNLDTPDLPDTPYQSSAPATREMRSPSELASRLLALFVRPRQHARHLLRNNGACTSLIGRCTSLPTSLTRVARSVAAAHICRHFRLRAVLSKQQVITADRRVLFAGLIDSKLSAFGKMSRRHPHAPGNMPSSSESSSDFLGDNLPLPDLLHRCLVQTTPGGFVSPFWGLGLPHRGAFGQGRNAMGTRCPRKGTCGGAEPKGDTNPAPAACVAMSTSMTPALA